jgi:hypothetical protein
MNTQTIDDLIQKRKQVQLVGEDISEEVAQTCWRRLGVVNRHIERLVSGEMILVSAIEEEIERNLAEFERWLTKPTEVDRLFDYLSSLPDAAPGPPR